MVWYLTLNPNIIVIHNFFFVLSFFCLFVFVAVVVVDVVYRKEWEKEIQVYFVPFIFIIVIIVLSLRWVEVVWVCVCSSTKRIHTYTLMHRILGIMLLLFLCVCSPVVRHCIVRWLYNELTRPNAMHWQQQRRRRTEKSNDEYDGRRWKCAPLSIRIYILTVFPHYIRIYLMKKMHGEW